MEAFPTPVFRMNSKQFHSLSLQTLDFPQRYGQKPSHDATTTSAPSLPHLQLTAKSDPHVTLSAYLASSKLEFGMALLGSHMRFPTMSANVSMNKLGEAHTHTHTMPAHSATIFSRFCPPFTSTKQHLDLDKAHQATGTATSNYRKRPRFTSPLPCN